MNGTLTVGSSANAEPAAAAAEAVRAALRAATHPFFALVLSTDGYDHRALAESVTRELEGVPWAGCCTAGVFTNDLILDQGIVVGVISAPDGCVGIGAAGLVSADGTAAGKQAAFRAMEALPASTTNRHRAMILLPDGLGGNAADVVRGAAAEIGSGIAWAGGGSGDSLRFLRTAQYAFGAALEDRAVAIALEMSASFGVGIRHGWHPYGPPTLVSSVRGTTVVELEYESAFEIYRRTVGARGDVVTRADFAAFARTHPLGIPQANGEHVIRDPLAVEEDGGLRCVAPIANAELASNLATLKDVQERLVEAGKLAAVGQLAAGMAHEINNPLAYVSTNLEVLREALDDSAIDFGASRRPELRQTVGDAIDGASRIARIVHGLRTFARVEKERRIPVSLAKVLGSAIDMSFNEVRHRARLVKEIGSAPLVDADETRLCQVFINLLVNAAQAIPEGHADHNEIGVTLATDARGHAVVEVRDTGTGIPVELHTRIFEPFFTTKPIGAGTGLGLSICHGIVASHGGELQLESAPGEGTILRVILPPAQIATQTRPPSIPSLSTAPPTAPRSARVLVVDDEASVGTALRRVLKNQDVTLVLSGAAALEHLARHPAPDVILCDLMMPEMSGMELHGKLAALRPELTDRIVFMTGGAFTPAAYEFLASIPNTRLNKPFYAKALRAAVDAIVR